MSAILTWAVAQAGPIVLSYVGTKVAGRLTEHWWGKAVLAIGKAFANKRRSAADSLLEKLGKDVTLTAKQMEKLTPEERALLLHEQV